MFDKILKHEKFAGVALIIVITLVLSKVIFYIFKRLEKSSLNKNGQNTLVYKYLSKIVEAVLLLGMLFQIISLFVDLDKYVSTIIASSGVITVIIGLAAQESLGNVISGFFIMLFKPFKVGDRVVLATSNLTGYIEDITLRHTIIRTYFNSRYIIPNSKMNSEVIENSSLIDERAGMYLDVVIDLNEDAAKAIHIIQIVIEENPDVLDLRSEQDKLNGMPIASVLVRSITLYGIELRSSVSFINVDASFLVLSDLRIAVIQRFKEEGIKLAKLDYKINE